MKAAEKQQAKARAEERTRRVVVKRNMLKLRAAKLAVMAIHHRRLLVKLRQLKKAVRATRARVIKSQAGLASALNRINQVKAAASVTLKAVRASPLPFATYNHHHVGCFVDRARRDLPNRLGSSGDMTPSKCHDLAQAAGFAFYAVQNARECWGGNSYGKYGQSKACTMDCAGDSFTTCGGTWANQVFFVSSSDANASKRARTAFSLVATVRSRAKKAMRNVRRAQNNLKVARKRVAAAVKKARSSLVRRALASARLALANAQFARRQSLAAAQAVAKVGARVKALKVRARKVKKSLAKLVVRVDADTVVNTHEDAMLAALNKLARLDSVARARWSKVAKPVKKVDRKPKVKKVAPKAEKAAPKAKKARVVSCSKAALLHAADVKAAKAALLVAQLHLTTAKTSAQKASARSAIFTAKTLLAHLDKRGIPTCINKVKKALKPLAVLGVTAPANGGEYVKFSPIRVSGKRFDLAFSATGIQNARIAFMAEEDDASSEAYEVVLGLSGDMRSELRVGTNGKVVAQDEKAGRLASKKPFWVTLREGVLFVGQGKFGKNSFMSAPVPKLGKTLSVGYAADQSPVEFRAMKIRRGGKRPTCKSQSKKIARLQQNIRKIERSLYQIKLTASAKKLTKPVKKVRFHLRKALSFAQMQLVADRAVIKGLCKAVRVSKKSARPTASPIVFAAAGNNGHYNVFAAKVSRKQFRLSFVAEATNDIYVAFMSDKSDRSPSAVEVAIGGWADNQSVIRQGTQGRELASNTSRGQAKACAKGCWISYQNGKLSVGQKGKSQPFMAAKVTLPAGQSLHVALGAWDHPVYFSQVRVA